MAWPIETKCLMYVNARSMVIDIHKTFGFNRKNLSLNWRAIRKLFSFLVATLELGVDGGVIRVTGHSSVLDMLETRHSEGLELGSPWLEAEGELHIPVYLSLSQYTSSPSVSVSVPATGQSVSVSIIPLVSSCKTNTGFISAMFGELLAYYQTVICIIIVSVITAYVTKSQFSKTQVMS